MRSQPNGGMFHIEDIQDHVELALMRAGHQTECGQGEEDGISLLVHVASFAGKIRTGLSASAGALADGRHRRLHRSFVADVAGMQCGAAGAFGSGTYFATSARSLTLVYMQLGGGKREAIHLTGAVVDRVADVLVQTRARRHLRIYHLQLVAD
mgnify:CR=1 FL=1